MQSGGEKRVPQSVEDQVREIGPLRIKCLSRASSHMCVLQQGAGSTRDSLSMGSNIQEGRERGCPRPSVASIISSKKYCCVVCACINPWQRYIYRRMSHSRVEA